MSETLSIFSWNVQSPGQYGGSADPEVVAQHLQEFRGYDIYGFCEVLDQTWANGFRDALQESERDEFALVPGTTGWGGDKLLILYRERTLEQMAEPEELMDMREGGGRAPLVVTLSLRPEGTTFRFMMNHLHSNSYEKRRSQTQKLNQWVREEELPVIAAGDYNFFGVSTTGSPLSDEGFRLLTEEDRFGWVRPEQLVRTQFDPHYDADWILDFVFIAGEAKSWDASSEILLADRPREYFLTPLMTDHRPVTASFSLPADS